MQIQRCNINRPRTPNFRMDLVNADSAIEMMCPNSMKTPKILEIAKQATDELKAIGDSQEVELTNLGKLFMLAYKDRNNRDIFEPLNDYTRAEDANYTFEEVSQTIISSLKEAAQKLHKKYEQRTNKQPGPSTIALDTIPRACRIK